MNRDEVIEAMSRFACEWEADELSPDMSLDGNGVNTRWREAQETLIKPLLQIIQDSGYSVVPVEPTEVMLDAQFMAYNSMHNIGLSDWDRAKAIYKAMLEAAK